MKHFIIGTAGHVDHGKTVLVKALTGKDTDRLKEEKERGISIELGFAPFQLPSGQLAGLVDVPGHERFIKNMLAGVGGIDLVLMVIAADEGIMPQTREHLGIIDLLQVPQGIIVITKTDLVEPDWIELVREEIRELVGGTVLENAPIAEVSGVTGQGIPELIKLIDQVAGKLQDKQVSGLPRMPIDRVFTVTGFGTVVTGTLAEGRILVGDRVEILPESVEARVRGLQVHGQKVELAEAGQRVAVNLAGLEHEDITRGSVLAAPGLLKPSHRLDIKIKLLKGEDKPLANRTRVRVHIGTAEILARVILLETEELGAGETGFAQLECEQPMVAARGDRLVIRSYSPMHTIGGGKIVDPYPPKRKRFAHDVIEILRTKEKGEPEELVRHFIVSSAQIAFTEDDITKGLGLDRELVRDAIVKLVDSGQVRQFTCDNRRYNVAALIYEQKAEELIGILDKFHHSYPLRAGMLKEEVRSKHFSGLNNKLFNALMELYQAEGKIRVAEENIARQDFEPGPQPDQQKMFESIERKYLNSGLQTPGWDEVIAEFRLSSNMADEILNYFLNKGLLVKLEEGILLHRLNLDRAKEAVMHYLQEKSEISLAEARDILQTSRKFALPIMNYLDKEKVTRRIEDKRVLY